MHSIKFVLQRCNPVKKKNRSHKKKKINLCFRCSEEYDNDHGIRDEIDSIYDLVDTGDIRHYNVIDEEYLAETLNAYGIPFKWDEVDPPNSSYKDKKFRMIALRKMINKEFPFIINNHFTMHCTGGRLFIIDTKTSQEYSYLLYSTKDIWHEDSHFNKFKTVFDIEDRFSVDVNYKREVIRAKEGMEWIMRDDSDYPELNLSNGGFIDVKGATYRKRDVIPAMVCNHEVVFTQEAVRGMGRGSHSRGGDFAILLNDHFEKEAKKYAHKR